jgi:hypothetical protein
MKWEVPKLEKINLDANGCDNGISLSGDCTPGADG